MTKRVLLVKELHKVVISNIIQVQAKISSGAIDKLQIFHLNKSIQSRKKILTDHWYNLQISKSEI
jgi:hypothetical protein